MFKRYNIKWTDADHQLIQKSVRNFNDKIRRIEKKIDKKLENPNLTAEQRKDLRDQKNYLPSRIKKSDIYDNISTRQDLKREINSLKRFSKKGAEKIVVLPNTDYNLKTTKWQKREMSISLATINRRRKKRYEIVANTEIKSRCESQGYKRGDIGIGKIAEYEVRPMKMTSKKMTQSGLKARFEAIRKEIPVNFWDDKDNLLKENFLKGLKANYNASKYKSAVEAIEKRVTEMSFREFWKIFNEEDGTMEIVSPPPGSGSDDTMDANITALLSTWCPVHVPTDFKDTYNKVKDGKKRKQKKSKEGKRK